MVAVMRRACLCFLHVEERVLLPSFMIALAVVDDGSFVALVEGAVFGFEEDALPFTAGEGPAGGSFFFS